MLPFFCFSFLYEPAYLFRLMTVFYINMLEISIIHKVIMAQSNAMCTRIVNKEKLLKIVLLDNHSQKFIQCKVFLGDLVDIKQN